MRILGINNQYNYPNFTRRPQGEKIQEFQETCNQAFDYLGIQKRSVILHGSCFPSSGPDIGVGSPYAQPAEGVIKELMLYGFNGVQLGPGGEISSFDISPYSSKVFAKNPLFIDYKALTKPEYAEILSKETYDNITDYSKIRGVNYNYSDFLEAFENSDIALEEAYTSFKNKLRSGNENAVKLNEEFSEFKKKSKDWLVNDGIFKILSKMNGTDDFTEWNNKLDADLIRRVKNGDREAVKRYHQILNRSTDKIEKNSFTQFLIDKQIRANKDFRDKNNFIYINDLLVGYSKSDVWANRDAFLTGYAMGCPYGGKENSPQVWDLPVLNPRRLFKSDGSLDIAGEFLKKKLDSALEYCENIRIDHALGLVDPWIYKNGKKEVYIANGVVRSIDGNNISNLPHIDPDGNYRNILDRIVLPTLREKGIEPENNVWEDLVAETPVWKEIYRNKLHLPGISQLEWEHGENARPENTSLIASHDSDAVANMPRDLSENYLNYISGYLIPDPIKTQEREDFKEKLKSDPVEYVKAKFVDLFRSSKNIQIAFPDIYAINKRYNIPGESNNTNWKLRMNNNYVDTYYSNLSGEHPTALNIPELLSLAVQAKIDMEVAKHPENADSIRVTSQNDAAPLINKLNELADYLREPEQEEDSGNKLDTLV